MKTQPVAQFNEVIHSPVRLRICGLLRRVDEVDFTVIRDTLEITDAHLSKNVKILLTVGFVSLRKESSSARADARKLTWLKLTPAGRAAVEAHLAALARIAADADLA